MERFLEEKDTENIKNNRELFKYLQAISFYLINVEKFAPHYLFFSNNILNMVITKDFLRDDINTIYKNKIKKIHKIFEKYLFENDEQNKILLKWKYYEEVHPKRVYLVKNQKNNKSTPLSIVPSLAYCYKNYGNYYKLIINFMLSLTVKIYTTEILEGGENFLPLEYILTFLLFMNAYLLSIKTNTGGKRYVKRN